jgi:hypothetical protein
MAAGYLPLNLCKVPSTVGLSLKAFISDLIPLVHYLPLTLENLNDKFYMLPEMHRGQAANDLVYMGLSAGQLQLPNGTCVIIDETHLQPGKLEDRGRYL